AGSVSPHLQRTGLPKSNSLGSRRLCDPMTGTVLALWALREEANAMPDTHPVTGSRPAGAPPYEPVVRLGTPVVGVGPASHPNHPVLLPDPDPDDDVVPPPPPPAVRRAPKRHW